MYPIGKTLFALPLLWAPYGRCRQSLSQDDLPQKRDFFNHTIMVIGLTIAALRYQRMVIYSRLGIQIAIGISASRENHLKSDNVIDIPPTI